MSSPVLSKKILMFFFIDNYTMQDAERASKGEQAIFQLQAQHSTNIKSTRLVVQKT